MISIEQILFGGLLVLVTLLLVGVLLLRQIIRRRGITATATITQIEEKLKYRDSSKDKYVAYDYAYQYTDCHGQTQNGKLYKNASVVEFNVGDTVEVLYLRSLPHLSLYKPLYEVLSFVPWVLAVMWLVILCIFAMNI